MYTTKAFSLYKKSPETISKLPEGPNSGYLVIDDHESSAVTCNYIKELPLPQNRNLSVLYYDDNDDPCNEVYFIPVINQPLSLNRYYVIKADGKRKGQAYASSKEEDKGTSCFCFPYISDVQTRSFDPEDIYQQFELSTTLRGAHTLITAKSVAPNGHPPYFLRRTGWQVYAKPLRHSTLGMAQGLDFSLRAQLPNFTFPLSQDSSKPVIVGKWYCPFMFINDGDEKEQIKHSLFYEMTLKQKWKRIFYAEKSQTRENVVTIDVTVPTEIVKIEGYQKGEQEEGVNDKRFVWFKSVETSDEAKEVPKVGLSSLIVERMTWEEEKVGWVRGVEKQVKVNKHEEYQGDLEWNHYGCYVLCETFVLKRNNGSVVLTYEFRHTNQLRSKWE